jgi:hypothetical protein
MLSAGTGPTILALTIACRFEGKTTMPTLHGPGYIPETETEPEETVAIQVRLPAGLHSALKALARAEYRSMNNQIVWYLSESVKAADAGADSFNATAHPFRGR